MSPFGIIGLIADLLGIFAFAWTFFKKRGLELVRFGLILPAFSFFKRPSAALSRMVLAITGARR
jgi:hypothetical protein